ncbi:MAG TPA: DUF1990 family protein [Fredinandcohnia sp.]|nr:DUF1990 family protein [Fredinandcohnia sp.]
MRSTDRVPSWRFLRGWDRTAIDRALVAAAGLPRNFDPRPGSLAGDDFRHVGSQAQVAVEPPGPPVPGGAFERLWEAVTRFEHSDPRIVVAHCAPEAALRGRNALLEIKVLGLRYLCPVRIVATRAHADARRTLRAMAIDTLEGHLERGREWFLLSKDHASGAVRFRLQAAWRPGDFPNAWSHAGFLLLARHYQRAWHRLAHLRMRRIAAGLAPHLQNGDAILHEGAPMPAEPILLYAGRRPPRDVEVEGEEGGMKALQAIRPVVSGALVGLRSLAGPALVLQKSGRAPLVSRALSWLAWAEVIADKLPGMPARTRPLSLLARAVSGAFVASAGGGDRKSRIARGLAGAGSAVLAAHGVYAVRMRAARRAPWLGTLVALGEDALAFFAQRSVLARRSLR